MYCPHLFKIGSLSLLASLFFSLFPASAQTPDGSRAQDKPGIALVKPQAWSKAEQATVLEFLAFTDRSGYYEFRTPKTANYQVPTAKVVKLVIFPETPQFISNAEQRAALQKTLDEFAALSTKFPPATRYLEKALEPLKADAAKYDAGSVKENGQWTPRSAFYKQKAVVLGDLLRTELTSAPKIKEIDLATNQYFLGLQDLAKAEPSVRPMLDASRNLYDSLVRKEDRDALMGQLNAPSPGYEQAADLVRQLKTLKPEEDARANLFVKSWDTAVAKAGKLTKQITGAQTAFENAMPVSGAAGKAPVISTELSSQLEGLCASVKEYRGGTPPAAIPVPLSLADALTACWNNFPALDRQIQAHEYLEAKSIIDPLSSKADLIGPKTVAVLEGLQKKMAADIERFQLLRNEAKMLAENDKIEAALKKYEEAYAIIPAKDVAAQIEQLKKQ